MATKEEEILKILSNSKIDFDFIKEKEGFELNGYVPDPEGSKSGVTIASGFDLGSKDVNDLKGLGKPLIDKLTKYLGKKKEEAITQLNNFPLTISEEEATLLNKKAKEESLYNLSKQWKNKTGQDFNSLSPEKQTVVSSVSFQYGNLETETPDFWNQVTSNDWNGAYNNLMNFEDNYPTRRESEAQLLMEGISKENKLLEGQSQI
jgi:type VI secretion system secreted protein VgrG